MRNAKDIIQEYRTRGYDTFRIRAIAALRPEPMRSQILDLLDAEGESIDLDVAAEAETAPSDLKTPSRVMRAVVPGAEESAEPAEAEAEALVETDEAEEEEPAQPGFEDEETSHPVEPVAEAEAEIDTADADELPGEDEDAQVGPEGDEVQADAPAAAGGEETFDVTSSMILDDSAPAVAQNETSDSFWVEENAALDGEEEEFESVSREEEEAEEEADILASVAPAAEAETESALAAEESPASEAEPEAREEESEVDAALSAFEGAFQNADEPADLAAAAAFAERIDADIEAIFSDEPAEREESTVYAEIHFSPEREASPEGETAPAAAASEAESCLHLVRHEETAAPADEEEGRILYFEEIESERYSLGGIDPDAEESGWVDCGSGLILLPKSMSESCNAYKKASAREPLVPGADGETGRKDLDILLDAIEKGETVEASGSAFDALLHAVTAPDAEDGGESLSAAGTVEATVAMESDPAPRAPLAAPVAPPADAASDAFRAEVAALEDHLAQIETNLSRKEHELTGLRTLAAEKDEMISLLQNQLEESRLELSERNARLSELKAASSRMHEMTGQIARLQIERTELERERNILSTETVPALEEQQLRLVDLMEEEAKAGKEKDQRLRRYRRRLTVGYAAASLAAITAILTPLLGLQSNFGHLPGSSPREEMTPIQVVLAPDRQEEAAPALAETQKRIARIEREKAALDLAYRTAQADWQREKGALLTQVQTLRKEKESALASLVQDINRMTAERDRAITVAARGNSGFAAPGVRGPQPVAGQPLRQTPVLPVANHTPAPPQSRVYVVQRGDTLSKIVGKFYGSADKRLLKQIAALNRLADENSLAIGQQLSLPPLQRADQTVAMGPSDD